MAYSTARMTDDVRNFPPPPQYLVWVGSERHAYKNGQMQIVEAERGRGQVRHMPTLTKSKAYVRPHRSMDKFHEDWSIYLWDHAAGQWELQYKGLKGDYVKDNPLFQTVVRGEGKHDHLVAEVEDAIASITTTLQGSNA